MRPPFVGRARELASLERELVPGAVVTVLGTAGTGKTRLAEEVARRSAGRVRWLGSAPPDGVSDRRSTPTSLVVLDDPEPKARDRVRRLADCVPVLITGRDVLGCHGERVLAIGPLPPDDAERLAAARLGPDVPAEALRAIVELADGLPGGIELIALAARSAPLVDVLEDLRRVLDGRRAAGSRMPRSTTMALLAAWAAGAPSS